jgi:hypothetical protein
LHSVYNNEVSEIGEVPKLLNRLLDYQYMALGRTNLPWWFKQDNLHRDELWMISWMIPVETAIVGYGLEAIGG